MKAIIVVGDGLADRPLKSLSGRTPLEAALKENLDAVAREGVCGIMDVIGPGRPPGSDAANLALLGYDPLECYRGRGALEALGAGVDLRPGDVAFRGNFACVDEDGVVVDRRAGRVEGSIFSEYLSEIRLVSHPDVEVKVLPTLGHRLAVVLRGEGLSWKVSDTDPHRDGMRILRSIPLDGSQEAWRTADIVNELTQLLRELMSRHPINRERVEMGLPPVNAILLRGAGEPPAIRPLKETYGVRGACVAVTPTVRGACRWAGFDLYTAPGATGGVDTDALSKAKVVERILPEYDLVYLHIKGADNASHDGDPHLKIKVIEKIDLMVGYLLEKIDWSETYMAVTADHTTSTRAKEHVGDPVPLALKGPEVRADEVDSFSERSCARGGLGRIKGKELMPIILDLLGKMEIFGS
ncbi:2,3-bisphosphoglycerate-independent phosphoglycerate mutase [Candidatus Bathyarchaeota archaeon]|nr:2,3-bisphosphoglycerate-independent phosphoglycerate mutase [Candidatus Bathyarchaeota archaeon]